MVRLNFVGDVSLGAMFENLGKGVSGKINKGLNPFEFAKSEFANSDLNIANLECVLSSVSSKKQPFSQVLRCPEDYVHILKTNRVDVVNLANNHTLDHGREAFERMVKVLDENGIRHFGESRDRLQEDALIIPVKDIGLGFLGYYIEETITKSDYLLLIEHIKRSCKKAKDQSDYLILSLHWGHEYTTNPMSWQINLGKELMDSCGVNVLYGHHPHVLQGIVQYKNSLFAPSFGNFVFDEYFPSNRKTAILNVQLDENSDSLNYSVIPCYINSKFQPFPKPKLAEHCNRLNQELSNLMGLSAKEIALWDIKNKKLGVKGHLLNRLKIRALFIINIRRFIPYLKQIFFRKKSHV